MATLPLGRWTLPPWRVWCSGVGSRRSPPPLYPASPGFWDKQNITKPLTVKKCVLIFNNDKTSNRRALNVCKVRWGFVSTLFLPLKARTCCNYEWLYSIQTHFPLYVFILIYWLGRHKMDKKRFSIFIDFLDKHMYVNNPGIPFKFLKIDA